MADDGVSLVNINASEVVSRYGATLAVAWDWEVPEGSYLTISGSDEQPKLNVTVSVMDAGPLPTIERLAEIDAILQKTAQALFDDHEVTLDGCGINSHEACMALDPVARLLNLKTPTERYDELCDPQCTPSNLRCIKNGETRRNWCLTCLENA